MEEYHAVAELNCDWYECNGRYPLDFGHGFTKKEIEAMFDLVYPKGTKVYGYFEDDDKEYTRWYTEDSDGGWNHGWGFEKNLTILEGTPVAIK